MIETGICQVGIGSSAARRRIMANGAARGMKLHQVAMRPLGASMITGHSIKGTMRIIIIGVTSVLASRISLTALPTAAIIEAIMKYAMR